LGPPTKSWTDTTGGRRYGLEQGNARRKQPLMYLALAAYKAAGKQLDTGKGCPRFNAFEELPLDVIGDIVASTPVERRIELSEAARQRKK